MGARLPDPAGALFLRFLVRCPVLRGNAGAGRGAASTAPPTEAVAAGLRWCENRERAERIARNLDARTGVSDSAIPHSGSSYRESDFRACPSSHDAGRDAIIGGYVSK